MNDNNNNDTVLFVIMLVFSIFCISGFNYFIDPYYIFKDSTIKGINNVKTYKYTNKRTIVYSDIKLNSHGKHTAFTGNCLLSHYGLGLDDIAFFTIPVAKVDEVSNIIKNIQRIAPDIKTIYWGLFFDDFYNDYNEEVTDTLPLLYSTRFTLKDFINLFFSYNTTKYSIKTMADSIKNKGQDIIYVYPYREIAKKTYTEPFSFDALNTVKETIDFAEKNNIKLIIYYSPVHVSKKMDLYAKGMWQQNQELKKRLAQITDFWDYSLFNPYNHSPLNEDNMNFIDNIHPSDTYNNLIVNDLLNDRKIGTRIDKTNADYYLDKDTKMLKEFITKNQLMYNDIKKLTKKDANIKIRRKG